MSSYPPLDDLMQKRREARPGTLLLEVRMSYLSIFSYFFWLLLVLVLYFLIAYNYPHLQLVGVSFKWFLLIPLAIVLEILRRRHDNLYMLFSDKIIHQGGRLSLRSQRPIMNYEHIVMVAIDQDVMGRMLDYGDVELSSAAEDVSEVVLRGVRHPSKLAAIIETIVSETAGNRRSV